MPEAPGDENRLAWFMNERRLDLGLRWNDVAELADVSAEGLRAIRRDAPVPRELTQRGIERALQWGRGSVLRIINGGDPEVLSDRDGSGPELTPECGYERRILASAEITDELKRVIVLAHRAEGHTSWCLQPETGSVSPAMGQLRA